MSVLSVEFRSSIERGGRDARLHDVPGGLHLILELMRGQLQSKISDTSKTRSEGRTLEHEKPEKHALVH